MRQPLRLEAARHIQLLAQHIQQQVLAIQFLFMLGLIKNQSTFLNQELLSRLTRNPFDGTTSDDAVMDGNGGALARAFNATAQTTIIGFRIQNYSTSTTDRDGVIYLYYGSSGSQVKYCKFISNTTRKGNSGIICTWVGQAIIRGNWFDQNTLFTGDGAELDALYVDPGYIVELNKFNDRSGAYYGIYIHGGNNNGALIQYNFINKRCRLREGTTYTLKHNIITDYVQFHDEDPRSYSNHNNIVERNTFTTVYDPLAVFIVRVDGTTFTRNLAIGGSYLAKQVWGTTTGNTFTSNHLDGMIALQLDFTNYTESGTTTGSSSYNSSTGWSSRLASNQGADLKISVWPFTDQAGGALQSDFPYEEGEPPVDTTDPVLQTTTPSDGAAEQSADSNIVWNYNESIASVIVSVTGSTSGSLESGSTCADGNITCSGSTITYNPTGSYTAGETISWSIQATDESSNQEDSANTGSFDVATGVASPRITILETGDAIDDGETGVDQGRYFGALFWDGDIDSPEYLDQCSIKLVVTPTGYSALTYRMPGCAGDGEYTLSDSSGNYLTEYMWPFYPSTEYTWYGYACDAVDTEACTQTSNFTFTTSSAASSPTITSLSETRLAQDDGCTITGTNFLSPAVYICDNAVYGSCSVKVEQTIDEATPTSITFLTVRGALPLDTAYLYVVNSTEEVTDAETVRIIATGYLSSGGTGPITDGGTGSITD